MDVWRRREGWKLGLARTRSLTGVRWPEGTGRNEAAGSDDDPKTRDTPIGRAVARNGLPRWATNAPVGGVQGLEAGRGRSDDGMDADDRRSCSRGLADSRTPSGGP